MAEHTCEEPESRVAESLVVVVPCHDEQSTVPEFLKACALKAEAQLQAMGVVPTYLFVDDGSTDGTLQVLRDVAGARKDVAYLSFSRNFGKEAAMYAGLKAALSFGPDYAAIMDCDLQDPPELLPDMVACIRRGSCDRVSARRVSRTGEPPIRSWFARRFYALMKHVVDFELVDGARDFSVMTPRFVSAVLSCGEYNRFTKGLFGWVGFSTEWVAYPNVERVAGETSWSFWALMHYALDGIVAYTVRPLEVLAGFGAVTSLIATCALVFVVVRALLFGDPVAGWPSLMTVVILTGGLLMLALGIIGFYLSKIYLEVKRRPLYVVAEAHGVDA